MHSCLLFLSKLFIGRGKAAGCYRQGCLLSQAKLLLVMGKVPITISQAAYGYRQSYLRSAPSCHIDHVMPVYGVPVTYTS